MDLQAPSWARTTVCNRTSLPIRFSPSRSSGRVHVWPVAGVCLPCLLVSFSSDTASLVNTSVPNLHSWRNHCCLQEQLKSFLPGVFCPIILVIEEVKTELKGSLCFGSCEHWGRQVGSKHHSQKQQQRDSFKSLVFSLTEYFAARGFPLGWEICVPFFVLLQLSRVRSHQSTSSCLSLPICHTSTSSVGSTLFVQWGGEGERELE